jgi:hypothetical protein
VTTSTPRIKTTLLRQQRALAALANVLVARGAPSYHPFGQYDVPSRTAMQALEPEAAAAWALTLVRTMLQTRPLPVEVTTAVKRVGNAARAVRTAIERERSRQAARRSPAEAPAAELAA